jgi:hypothetical protein
MGVSAPEILWIVKASIEPGIGVTAFYPLKCQHPRQKSVTRPTPYTIRQIHAGELDPTGRRLATVANVLLKAIETRQIENAF